MYYKNRFCIVKYSVISLVVASNLYGAPSGGTVVSGNATISQNANTTNINQSSNKAVINWQDFSIKSNETVNFNQPNVNSITLNRVIGNEKSIIDGALNANGQVWLINSNGVLFGKNAKVNTAGIVASTKDISNEDFNNGKYNFKGNSTSSIVNEGEIKSLANTHATFIANSVTNKGIIEVHKGTINLVGASDVTLTLNENQNLSLKVNKGVVDALVDNQNLIVANGGQIYLTTNAKDELLKGVVNHSGIIEANSLDELTQSEVILFAHGGTANISGEIKAKNSFVETSGEKLNVTSNTKVIAKDWLLDPTDILIESTGGDVLTGESVSATAIQNNLETTNVHLQATNNITVNQNITWNTDKQLKLQADNINVNATINNTNQTNGGVYFQADNTTNNVVFDTNGKVVVNNIYQLQWINQALNGKYELGSNIDASATSAWNSNGSGGYDGFNPIGDNTNNFNGTFDGLGFTISNLYINRPDTNFVGLFGFTNNATIKNIGLKDVDIIANINVGGLFGYMIDGTIKNSYVSGTVIGIRNVGTLVGANDVGTISNSYASGSVSGNEYAGGLVGYEFNGTISNSFYDKEANTATMQDSVTYGKTKAEIATLLKNASSEWETDFSKGRGNGASGIAELPFLKNVTKLSNTWFEDGHGTEANPYTITNWIQLRNINHSNNVIRSYYFNLSNNIDRSTTGYIGNGEGWNPIGDASNKFIGIFDGKGFTISDLYINRPSQNYIGLFGYINNSATIKNIGLENLSIVGKSSVGGLVGQNSGTISNSYASGAVRGGTASYIGGLVGSNDGTITNSYALGSVGGLGGSFVGGLVGWNFDNGKISNSYASGTASRGGGGDNAGGLVGLNYATITNSYYDRETNTNSMDDSSYGKTKAEILSSFSNVSGWGTTGGGASVSGYEVVLLPYLLGVTKDEYKSKSILFNGGFGTEANPYTITNWTQLQNINNSNIVTSNYYFNLLNNIDRTTAGYMGSSGEGWNSIGKNATRALFQFDGLGNTISDLYINRPNEDLSGLFGHTQSGSNIQNIGLLNVNITGGGFTGGLVGANYFTNITNSYVTGTVIGNDINIGGLAGANSGIISNSYAIVTVAGNGSEIGGLVGDKSSGTISNSFYDKTKNPNYDNGLGTGKTTAELEDIDTFKNASWSITADSSLAKGTPILRDGAWVIGTYVAPTPNPSPNPTPNPTPNPIPSDNNQKQKVDEKVQRVIASIEPSTNSNSYSNQSVPNSLNINIRTLSFSGVDETRVINGGVKMPENIANEEDIIK